MITSDNKIVLIGDSGVGKSTIMLWLLNNKYTPFMQPTIGASFCIKTVDINGTKMKLNIWDTAGQERFRSIAGMYYKNTIGCICVFDVTNRKSFSNVEYWLSEYREHNNLDHYGIILVGNKCDADESKWNVSRDEANMFAKKHQLPIIYTNCITGDNVINVFEILCKMVIEIKKELMVANEFQYDNYITILDDNTNKNICEC